MENPIQMGLDLPILLSQRDVGQTEAIQRPKRHKYLESSTHCLHCGDPIPVWRQKYGAKYCKPPKPCYRLAREKRQAEQIEQRRHYLKGVADKQEWLIERLTNLALEKFHAGYQKYGIDALSGELRWRQYRYGRRIRFSNNLRPHLARAIMARDPRLEGFFDTEKF